TATENGKLSVSIANSPKVSLSNITTAKSPWKSDIGIMLGDKSKPFYGKAVNLTISGKNTFANNGLIYSENTRDDSLDELDTITFKGSEETLYKLAVSKENDGEQYYYVTEKNAADIFKSLGKPYADLSLVAFSDDGTDHPLVYTSLND